MGRGRQQLGYESVGAPVGRFRAGAGVLVMPVHGIIPPHPYFYRRPISESHSHDHDVWTDITMPGRITSSLNLSCGVGCRHMIHFISY